MDDEDFQFRNELAHISHKQGEDTMQIRWTRAFIAHKKREAQKHRVNILATDQLCHAAFVLRGGQIEAQAEIPMAATTFTAAITGGTGAFEGASGHIDNVRVAPGVVDRTFHLLARHH